MRLSWISRSTLGLRPGRSTALLGLVLAGCAGDDCPKGSVLNTADGLCYLSDGAELAEDGEGSAPDTGGSTDGSSSDPEDTGDTGEPVEDPVVVADGCELPDVLPDDPLTDLGALFLQDYAFAEAVDIELDTAAGVAVLAGQGGLMVVDISDEAAPRWVGHDGDMDFRQRFQNIELAASGLVYATHWDIGLAVYDIRSGPDPVLGSSVVTEGLGGMALNGDVLYVVDKMNGELGVWDVSAPGSPALLTSIAGLDAPFAPFVRGSYVYVADNSLGLVTYDVSSPELPVRVGTVAADASIQDLAFSSDGTTLYAAAGGAGIQVYALDDPAQPELVETIPLAYSVISVDTGDGLLWAVDQQDVIAIDISSPRVPVVLNAHRTGQWSMHVAAEGKRAWVADWAYLRGYRADGLPVGDLNPSSSQVYLAPEGASATIQLMNPGGADLVVSGVQVDDPRVGWSLSDGRVPAGGSVPLSLEFDGGGPLEATVCIASNDPDMPRQEVSLVSIGEGARAGVGKSAPDFMLDDLDGTRWRLSDLRGRPVVLAYFATW